MELEEEDLFPQLVDVAPHGSVRVLCARFVEEPVGRIELNAGRTLHVGKTACALDHLRDGTAATIAVAVWEE